MHQATKTALSERFDIEERMARKDPNLTFLVVNAYRIAVAVVAYLKGLQALGARYLHQQYHKMVSLAGAVIAV